MPYYEREEKILSVLYSCDEISTANLAERLFVSLPTLRRDLIKLENKGLVYRMHGKVSLRRNAADTTIPFIFRTEEHQESKNIIARKAVECVKDGNVIMMDGSTSAYCLVPYLAEFKNIIVITSGARTALLLSHYGISTVCTGGHMLNSSFTFIGADAVSTIKKYNADILFFSCRGISEDGVLTDNSIDENDVRRHMMANSDKKILLCDSSKFNKKYVNNLCSLKDVDLLVSENNIPPEYRKLIK